ncbi:MAG: VanZ family protein [Burkholderiaceae bacterium]|nr:VanZ family protein [Burkholderiaceae bacterium]
MVAPSNTPRQTIAWPLTLAYIALVIYASLYPFTNWRDQGVAFSAFLFQPWPKYWTLFDVLINVLGYAPLGFLGALAALRTGHAKQAIWLVTLLVLLLSFCMESTQSYLLARVASNVDFGLNMLGGLVGALCAWTLEKLGAIDHWSHFKQTWFVGEAQGAMVLLALWPLALVFPAAVPLGLGQVLERLETALGGALAGTPFLEWLPMRTLELQPLLPGAEMLCVMLGALVPTLLGYSVIQIKLKRAWFLVVVSVTSIAVSVLSAGLTYGPDHATAWLTLPVKLGLLAALVLSLPLLALPRRACAALLLLALLLQLFVLNLAPANPYFAQTLQTWEQGRFIRFHGVVQWLGWLWPFVTVGYVMQRLSRPGT